MNTRQILKDRSGHFFDKGAMQYFKSRLESVQSVPYSDDIYFVTSEKFEDEPRFYQVRVNRLDVDHYDVFTISPHGGYPTLAEAKAAMKSIAGVR